VPRELPGWGDGALRPGRDRAVAKASQLLSVLRRRREVMPGLDCGDPTWEMLLDLFVRKAEGYEVSVTSACIGSGAPSTTAKRHLGTLEDRGYVARRSHPADRRSTVVYLTDKGSASLESLLAG
jgi:hypothetical protein